MRKLLILILPAFLPLALAQSGFSVTIPAGLFVGPGYYAATIEYQYSLGPNRFGLGPLLTQPVNCQQVYDPTTNSYICPNTNLVGLYGSYDFIGKLSPEAISTVLPSFPFGLYYGVGGNLAASSIFYADAHVLGGIYIHESGLNVFIELQVGPGFEVGNGLTQFVPAINLSIGMNGFPS